MNAYDSIAPPDKVDRTPMDEALRALLGALASVRQGEKPSVTLLLGEAEWARARTYYQRPYQRKPTSEFGVYLAEGTVWFQRAEEARPGELHTGMCRSTEAASACAKCASEEAEAKLVGEAFRAGLGRIGYNQETLARVPVDRDAVNARALQTGTQVLGSSSSVTSTAGESGAVYGGRWVAPEDKS